MSIDYVIPIVCDKFSTPNRISAHKNQLAGDFVSSHGNDLYRKREFAEPLHPFRIVCNTKEFFGHGTDYFFLGKRATSTLYHLQFAIYLISTVNIDFQF